MNYFSEKQPLVSNKLLVITEQPLSRQKKVDAHWTENKKCHKYLSKFFFREIKF